MKIKLIRPDYDCFRPDERTDDRYSQMVEQVDYLEGVLWSDPARRMDRQVNPDDIDRYGHGSPAFWRGFLETAGAVTLTVNREIKYPRVTVNAVYPVLAKFLAFVQDELQQSWTWDADGTLDRQAAARSLKITGVKAQDVCRILYPPGSVVGQESVRAKIDEIFAWTARS